MKQALLIVSLSSLFFSCSSPLSSLSWVEGDWVMALPNGNSRVEIWDKTNKQLYTGKGVKVVAGDSTIKESLQLTYQQEAIWYIPTVPDQNNAEAVPFKLVSQTGRDYVFENPEHDFPQRILYRYLPAQSKTSDTDSMYVRVESLDGHGIDYWFKRN